MIKGVVLNKDVTHSKMRREIANPRIILLDGPLEYKKGESQVRQTSSFLFVNAMDDNYVANLDTTGNFQRGRLHKDLEGGGRSGEAHVRCDHQVSLKMSCSNRSCRLR